MSDHVKQSIFPHPEMADEDGLLCIGLNLEVGTLVDAYYHGIFPWPQEELPVLWFSPPMRGILNFSNLHISKRLSRFKSAWEGEFRINTAFEKVINSCRLQKRPGQAGTWILSEMVKAYTDLYNAGYAHSVEAWENNQLVGGIYGVFIGNVFSGESMFYNKSNCSKLCFLYLVEHLEKIGLHWMDVQMLTPLTQSFGGEYIERKQFLKRLETEHGRTKITF
ncbi:MAG: leucyl/phenylalanyl-tRNA--protein transferase [Spirochaetes bacterium]|nr:leucyl/phenylalanyl-tRNA--protein transferase [Spirochaetota bacterium]